MFTTVLRWIQAPPSQHLRSKINRCWSPAALYPPTQTDSSSADTGWSGLGAGSDLWDPIGWLAIKAACLLDGPPAGWGADPAVRLVQAVTPSGCYSVEKVWQVGRTFQRWTAGDQRSWRFLLDSRWTSSDPESWNQQKQPKESNQLKCCSFFCRLWGKMMENHFQKLTRSNNTQTINILK